MAIQEIQSEATSLIIDLANEKGLQADKLEFRINDKQRPKICTEFRALNSADGLSDKAVVSLSDNSRWTIEKGKNFHKTLNTIRNWQAGDDIRIKDISINKIKGTKSLFLLHNVRTSETVPFIDQDHEFLLAYVTTTLKKVDPSGYTAQTSDGRLWSAGGWFNYFSKEAQESNKVLINKGEEITDANYLVIDPNHSTWGHPLLHTRVTEQTAFKDIDVTSEA